MFRRRFYDANVVPFFVPQKLIAVLLALLVVIGSIFLFQKFSSSSDETSAQDLSRIAANLSGGFTANLSMEYGDFQSAAQFEQRYIGDCTFRFSSPPSLDGFELTLSDGKVTVCYRGISSSISNDQLFESSGAGLFLQALETITSMQGLSSQTEDGILTLSLPGSEEDPAFSAKLNPTDAELLEVSFPQEKFKVVVSDFSPSSAN